MKRLVVLFALVLMTVSAIAQETKTTTISDNSMLERKGTQICYVNGRPLLDNEILTLVGQDRFDTYCGGRKQLRSGKTLVTIGFTSVGLAIASIVVGAVANNDDFLTIAPYLAIPADVCLPLGFVFKGIGQGRINWVCDDYNKNKGNISLNFTPAVMKANIPGQNNPMAFGATLSLSF